MIIDFFLKQFCDEKNDFKLFYVELIIQLHCMLILFFLLAWNENLREWDMKKNVTMTEKNKVLVP